VSVGVVLGFIVDLDVGERALGTPFARLGTTFDDFYEDDEDSDDSAEDEGPSTPKRAVVKEQVVEKKGGVHFTREAEAAGEEKPVMKPGLEAGASLLISELYG
jgi:hypothetical protein